MLKQRVITALVLLAILLPTLFCHSPIPFSVIALLLIAAAAWEWSRLNGYGSVVSLFFGFMSGIVCAVMWWLGVLAQSLVFLWILASATWVLAGAWVLFRGVSVWSDHSRVGRLVLGLLALWITWIAVVQARMIGSNFLLSILALVWTADVFAYFSGKAFGGRFCHRKLAPTISPGKSWEGVWGGMLGVMALAFFWRWVDAAWGISVPSFYTHLGLKGEWLLLIAVVFVASMSVVGDLFESLVKRSAGAKDSSGLLPGHGGVLDRVDALLPTLPIAMMLYSL